MKSRRFKTNLPALSSQLLLQHNDLELSVRLDLLVRQGFSQVNPLPTNAPLTFLVTLVVLAHTGTSHILLARIIRPISYQFSRELPETPFF